MGDGNYCGVLGFGPAATGEPQPFVYQLKKANVIEKNIAVFWDNFVTVGQIPAKLSLFMMQPAISSYFQKNQWATQLNKLQIDGTPSRMGADTAIIDVASPSILLPSDVYESNWMPMIMNADPGWVCD